MGPVDPGPTDFDRDDYVVNDPIVIDDNGEPLPWEEEWEDEWDEEWDDPYMGDNLNLTDVAFEGVLGPVNVIEGDTLRVDSYHEAYGDGFSFTQVQTTAPQVADGAAMVLLFIDGGLDHPALVPGARYSFSQGESDVGGLNIDGIGCSGPDDGNWSDYDQPADEIDVEIEEGEEPGTQVLSYRATFYDYDGGKTSADGSFTYNPSDI